MWDHVRALNFSTLYFCFQFILWNKWSLISVILYIVIFLSFLSLCLPLPSSLSCRLKVFSPFFSVCLSVCQSSSLSDTCHTQIFWMRWRVWHEQQDLDRGTVWTVQLALENLAVTLEPDRTSVQFTSPKSWKGNCIWCQHSSLIRFYLFSCWYW